jgi:hypothetical protein
LRRRLSDWFIERLGAGQELSDSHATIRQITIPDGRTQINLAIEVLNNAKANERANSTAAFIPGEK